MFILMSRLLEAIPLYGYAGELLKVNLSEGRVSTEKIEKETVIDYIGGKVFGARILLERTQPGIDPLDPRNLLIFATGPANGLAFSGAAKFTAVFMSPLTGIWGGIAMWRLLCTSSELLAASAASIYV